MSSLSGKIAIVTGGSKGIGRATVLALAKQGATVVINYGRDSAPANELAAQVNGLAIQADAGSVQGVEKIVTETLKAYGQIDILIANAATMPMRDVASTTEEEFDKTFALNVKGPYFLVQKAAPHMKPGSHIVLTSTSLSIISSVAPNYLLYCSTKGAIEQMTRLLSKDLGRRDISVNCVAPGPTATELFFEGKSEQVLKGIAAANPHNRIGTPEEVADAIVFLSSEQSRWISGQIVRVNGGMA